jgi:hypothetical protein
VARGNDNPRLGVRLAAVLGTALVLGMAAVALNAGRGTALAGDGPAKGKWLLLAVGVVVAGWVLGLRVRRSQDRLPAGGSPTQSRIASLVVPGFVLMALATAVALAVLGTRGMHFSPPNPDQGVAAPSAGSVNGNGSPSPWTTSAPIDQPTGSGSSPIDFRALLLWFAVLAGVAVLALLIVLLVRWLNARRRAGADADGAVDGGLEGGDTGEALAGAVLAGREALADDPDPRTAIIACYAAMEASLGEGGISRQKADTPADLLERAVAAGLVQGFAAQTLTDLFREARYSTHPMGEHQRDQARAALESISAYLAAAKAEADARFGVREEMGI